MDKNTFVYAGKKTSAISFPLGGIGTGCVGLAGNGRLVDWQIFNKPAIGSTNGFSHFAIKVEADGQVLDTRVLQGDLQPPYSGDLHQKPYTTFGFGPPRESMAGVPHFRDVVFTGKFPIAELDFKTPHFPGKVELTAFNPFIPMDPDNSSLPAAFLEFHITNTTDQSLSYKLAGSLHNPLPAQNINRYKTCDALHLMSLTSDGRHRNDLNYGEMVLGAACEGNVSYCEYWYRGRWFDSVQIFWDEFSKPGRLHNRRYIGTEAGEGNCATLVPEIHLDPGEKGSVRFVITWYFPNRSNYWRADAEDCAHSAGLVNQWRNFYASLFPSAEDTAKYCLEHWDELFEKTLLFRETLLGSSLPPFALDAISANLAVLKSPTVMRLEDGTFYGFEGCHPDAGCCEGSCTHVWNYAQALPFLFPSLERSMREANYAYNQHPDGGMAFRLQLPVGVAPSQFRPCVDGQFGDVLKVYREWKISGDTEWLKRLWPAVKRSIEFAWSNQNEDRWDPDKTGVLQGRQHHTLDMELFSPNSWLTGFYLGALKAGAEMAACLGEKDTADEYMHIFERGKAWVDAHLFNGQYYHQFIALKSKELLLDYTQSSTSMVGEVLAAYWDDEHGEIKYQIGEGCGIDQVLAQWHANMYGLGEIFDPDQVYLALKSLFAYNFIEQLGEFFNPCRVFGLNDEAGLTICSWPPGREKPVIPIPYAQEVMTGFEYAAASHMLQIGLIEEGETIIRAIRDRYDGEKRNPWNEIECGSHYARSMASYAILNTYGGFSFDMVQGVIGFNPPVMGESGYQCFWSLGTGWGNVFVSQTSMSLTLLYGTLLLRSLFLPFLPEGKTILTVDGASLQHTRSDACIQFSQNISLKAGQSLVVKVQD